MCCVVAQQCCPHTAETLWKLKSEVMAHPPQSPELAPFDYHLFEPSIQLGPTNEESGACMSRCSVKSLLFGGQQEVCAMMDQVR